MIYTLATVAIACIAFAALGAIAERRDAMRAESQRLNSLLTRATEPHHSA